MSRGVLFDFDGTLADTAPDMVAALNIWRAARGKPPADLQETGKLCSGGARVLLELSGWRADETFEEARADYLRRYEETAYQKTVLFAGVAELLADLAGGGWRWGVVTNKPRRFYAPISDNMRLASLGAAAQVCGDDVPQAKPAPLSLLAAAEQCGVAPQNCLYVGDDVRDAMAAAAAGMKFCAVTWGYWQPPQWEAEDAPPVEMFAATPKSLAALLRSI